MPEDNALATTTDESSAHAQAPAASATPSQPPGTNPVTGTPDPSAQRIAELARQRDDWRNNYQNLVPELKESKAEVAELKAQVEERDRQLSGAKSGATQVTANLATVTNERDTLKADLERLQIVMEYPDLLPRAFDKKDEDGNVVRGIVRPDLQGDELRAHLKDLQESFKDAGKQAVGEAMQGASAPGSAPSPGQPQTFDNLYDLSIQALNNNDMAEFMRIQAQIAKQEDAK